MKNRSPDINKCLSSARILSILMILVTYVGWNIGFTDLKRIYLLFSVRKELAANIILDSVESYPAISMYGGLGMLHVVDDKLNYLPGIGTYKVDEKHTILLGSEQEISIVTIYDLYGKKRWSAFVPTDVPPGRSVMIFNSVALELGLIPKEPVDLNRLYLRIEQKLLGEKTSIPGTGYSFKKNLAVWVAAVSVFFLLVLINNRIRQVKNNLSYELNEPWLILDCSSGVEKLIATSWLSLLVICPWIVNSGLIIRVASQRACDGATFSLSKDLVTFSFIFVLMTLSGWISLTVVSMILRIKAMVSESDREQEAL